MRRRRLLVTATSLTLLLAATHVRAETRAVRSLFEIRYARVIKQQWDNSCGAASLATLLTYDRNFPVTEVQVATGMLGFTDPGRVRSRGGFSLLDMKKFLDKVGFEGEGSSDLDAVALPQNLPAIVPIKLRGYDHFVVVRSIDSQAVQIADPGWGEYAMSADEFRRSWTGVAFTAAKR